MKHYRKGFDLFAEAYIKVIADAFISELISRGVGAVLDDAINPILTNIERIEEKIERQSLVHLKAGITFLKLQEIDLAVAELVRAEAADGVAPVPSFWLGATLALTGRRSEAKNYLYRAFSGNPYLLMGHGRVGHLIDHVQAPIRSNQRSLQREYRVSDLAMHPTILPPWWKRWAMDLGRRSSVAAMAHLGSGLLIQCNLDEDCRNWSRDESNDVDSVISVFDSHLNPIWMRKIQGEFLFSTPDLSIIRNNSRYLIISNSSGELIRDCGCEYFENAYFPNLESLIISDEIGINNYKFKSYSDVFKIKKGRKFDLFETKLINGLAFDFQVENDWKLRYSRASGGRGRSRGVWTVSCQSKLIGGETL